MLCAYFLCRILPTVKLSVVSFLHLVVKVLTRQNVVLVCADGLVEYGLYPPGQTLVLQPFPLQLLFPLPYCQLFNATASSPKKQRGGVTYMLRMKR